MKLFLHLGSLLNDLSQRDQLIFIFLVIAGGKTDFEEDSILSVLSALGGLSLLVTPFLVINLFLSK